jgi:prepilin-type N-terminal cleavage/methylation domain-containing protein
MTPYSHQNGFTLIETIVATAIVATALSALAHLFVLGAAQTHRNRQALPALAAAQGKLRQLQAAAWTSVSEAPELAASPADTLTANVAGFVEHLDNDMHLMASTAPDADAAYVRRWAIRPLVSGDLDTLVLQVCVSRSFATDARSRTCVASIRTRRP